MADGLRVGLTVEDIHGATDIDIWFLEQMRQILAFEKTLKGLAGEPLSEEVLRKAKELGFSDGQIASLRGEGAKDVRAQRATHGVEPVYSRVDTCAAEF
ncbi:MAG: hypothetical protein JRG67_04245, partial [Deltaproteobacteria bacterium]|nr:hypothetical protein [Deltaproteobacteria bacterium]